MINPVKKNRSLEKDDPFDQGSINNNTKIYHNLKNNFNNNVSNKYKKLYKLFEPNIKQNEIKKLPKYKILNSLRNNNENKFNLYLKNREELYKDLYKNIGVKSDLVPIINKDKSVFDNSDGVNSNFSQVKLGNEIKIYKGKNKLSPISVLKRDSFQ